MRVLGPVLLAISMAPLVGADEIYLVGGGRISGEIVERNAQKIIVEIGPGRVTLPMNRVTKVEAGRSALSEFRERARRQEPGDAAGWVALGRWADARDLGTQAREAYQRALAVDPGNPLANAALGRALVDGRWLSEEEAYRAQGLVPFEGTWVTPAERDAVLRDRSQAELSEREAEARVREAEARARAAEAEAWRAEAEASTQEQVGAGIPYWPYLYGGGGGGYLPTRDPSCCRPRPEPRPTPAPPARRPPTGSLNGSTDDKSAGPPASPPAPGALGAPGNNGKKH